MGLPYDLVGPVLPQALRLARYQTLASLPQNLQSENDMVNQKPSREEERLLVSNANVMTDLENLFSWSEKDRTSRTSKLSHVESVRFQRAMYRIWLMSVLFGPRRFMSKASSVNEVPDRKADLEKNWMDQKSFLQQFSTQELFQIDNLAGFLVWTAQWAITAEEFGLKGGPRIDLYNCKGLFLFAGPHIILRCYEDFIEQALSEIVQVTVPFGYVGVILDDINGEHDRCHHCGSAGTPWVDKFSTRMLPNLYNETNWEELKGRLNQSILLPHNLSLNLVEEPLIQALGGDWSRLIHDMFACRRDEYTQWSKENWACNECWSAFFWDTLWRWRLWQKRRAREPVEKDCRNGYRCKEQCHESGLAQAKQFNHLGKPIGDTSTAWRIRRQFFQD